MTNNEIMAKALGIGQSLTRERWYEMSALEAEAWCKLVINRYYHIPAENEVREITHLAMQYVINNQREII